MSKHAEAAFTLIMCDTKRGGPMQLSIDDEDTAIAHGNTFFWRLVSRYSTPRSGVCIMHREDGTGRALDMTGRIPVWFDLPPRQISTSPTLVGGQPSLG